MIAPRDFTTELKPEPSKWLFFLVVFVAFVVAGVFLLLEGRILSLFMGGLAIVFGLAGTVAAIAALFSKRLVLRLTPEGFAYGTLRKNYFYRWSDVAVFGVGSVGVKKTCFSLKAQYSGEERIRAINQDSIGFDRFLPDTYGKTPMELAKLLEEWRYRYSDTKTTEL